MPAMGFNKRRMESERAAAAAKEAEARRALGPQILADAEHLVATWNARQEDRMPMLFAPTIGAAITARHWFLRVRCPACRTVSAVDLLGYSGEHHRYQCPDIAAWSQNSYGRKGLNGVRCARRSSAMPPRFQWLPAHAPA
jgi:hypothetical protein